jgi:hypothetical protein
MSERVNKLKRVIEKGSEIGGSVSGAAFGLVVAGPLGAIGGAAAGPLLTDFFKKVGLEISEKLFGDREKIRVGATFSLAYDKIENEVKKGKAIRSDSYIKSQNGLRSGAESILEGTLLKARDEYEEKKIKYYANFLANMNLDSSISFEKGNTLLRIIEQLSYRQLVILAYFRRVKVLNTNKWSTSFPRIEALGEFQDFYSELMGLYNQQLLQQPGPGIGLAINSMKLSPLGVILFNLLELDNIDGVDEELVVKTIEKINKIIEQS